MRHLASLVMSPVITVVIYVLVGIANVKSAAGLVQIDTDRPRGYVTLGVAIGCVAAAGALYSVLVLARLSPLGTVVAGLALVGVGAWAWFDHQSFLNRMPSGVPGVKGALHAAAGTTTIALGVPLVLTLFSPRRWRRYANPRPAATPVPGYAEAPGYAEPSGYPGAGSPAAPSYDQTPPYGNPSSYDDTPTYRPPTYGATLGSTETQPSSTSTDLFGNSRYPSSPVFEDPEKTRRG